MMIKKILYHLNFSSYKNYSFSNLTLKDIIIPKDQLITKFCRSSGPGGQNVNKVNTKAEIRINIETANWLKPEVKVKLKEFQKNSINSEGELIVTSQVTRTQNQNLDDAIEKLKYMIWEASLTEKERKFLIPTETEELEKRRINSKRKRSDTKRNRSGNCRE